MSVRIRWRPRRWGAAETGVTTCFTYILHNSDERGRRTVTVLPRQFMMGEELRRARRYLDEEGAPGLHKVVMTRGAARTAARIHAGETPCPRRRR